MRRLEMLGGVVVACMLAGARAQDLPRPPAAERVFPEWQAMRGDAAEVRKLTEPMKGTPPCSRTARMTPRNMPTMS